MTKMILQPRSNKQALAPRRSAFTLLEVLVVVAIIVMLAGVGGFYFFQQYEEAKMGTAKTNVQALSNLVDTYKLNNGDYPASLEALTQPQPNGSGPMCSPDKIRDPWGKIYQIDAQGTRNAGMKADVFTTTPKGQIIGNFVQ
jgi:general secretion pathway protein G